ncbi:chaplin [Streptomyces boluensis]|uniref:DUF320 domain-containing protein n=1 Tax=Streptomyces boluensis TaxID=1775135 RepID=A0A964UKU4_9ACTN|nr:chaplin [Streptomyces boluensis]NBE51063.1 DUF320 domain-containing protein [Streptomyces boluensis]
MRQVTRKGLITVAAASGVLAVTGYAHADSAANGGTERSPGVASGNSVQAPIEVPVNVCGNTVNVIGILNPAAGNGCANESDGTSTSDSGSSTGTEDSGGGATADGGASDSPGILSGNSVEAPVSVPVNACGNSVTGVGALNPTTGNGCGNDAGEAVTPPGEDNPGGIIVDRARHADPNEPKTQLVTSTRGVELAQTGSDLPLGVAVPVGAGLLLTGTVLYRRARVGA